MIKKYIFTIVAILFFLFGLSIVLLVINPSYKDSIIRFTSEHKFYGPMFLILWRILGIIVPAIPAGVVSFAVVPLFGWQLTYVYTLIGILVGTSTSFWLARKFREPLVARFLPLQKIHKLEDSLSHKKRFIAIVALRLFTVPVMDFSSYIAGLTKISFAKFFLATIIASIPDIGIFYLGEELYKRVFGKSIAIAVAMLFFLALAYFLFRKYKNKER
jgi:uncharacterized membrane protein YdjX (TVP38/TMEM64 family)